MITVQHTKFSAIAAEPLEGELEMKNTALITACALVALAGSSAGAQVIDWAAPVDGNWNGAANWAGANIPNAIGEDAILGHVSAYAVDMTNSFTISALSLTNPLASLNTGASTTLTLNGNLFNDGLIFINQPGSTFDSFLRFNTDATISGTGSVRLGAIGNPGDAQLISNTGFTLTNEAGHTIHGSGHLGGTIVNNGFIIANDAVGAGLKIAGTLTQGAGGNAGANTGTLLLGNGSVITGGTMSSINGGQVRVESGTATIGNITNSGNLNVLGSTHTIALNNSIENNGTISINSDNASFNAHLRFDTTSAVNGNGNIVMASPSNTGDAQILTSGIFDGTIGSNQTVEGSGLINGTNGGTIINNGIFIANDPAMPLAINGTHRGSGGGIYRADGATLQLANGLLQDGGTFDSSAGGIVDVTNNGVASLYQVTNLGDMGIRGQGGTIALTGPMTNEGTITINSDNAIFNAHLRFEGSDAITGSGLIHMVTAGNVGDAQLFTNGAVQGTIGFNQTVDGSGIVDGRSGGTIINNGTINGNHAIDGKTLAQPLELRGIHDGQGVGVYRSDDGILALGNGVVITDSIFDSSGVGIVDLMGNGVATISNSINNGHMGIRGQGGSLVLTSMLTNNGTLTINSDNTIFNAHLRFDNSTAGINGTGTVRMVTAGNIGDAQMFTVDTMHATIGADQTVAGSGIIEGRVGGQIINNGTINGDDPTAILELRGSHNGLGGGNYRADNGILGLRSGTIIEGGTFDSSGTGIVEHTTNGTSTMNNAHNLGTMGIRGQGSTLAVIGMTNDGIINVNSDGAIFNAHLRVDGGSAIVGTGTINMTTAGNSGDAQLVSESPSTATLDQHITGDGIIAGSFDMFGSIDPAGPTRVFSIDDIHMNAPSELNIDLGGLLAGEFDRIALGGADVIHLDGSLTVNIDPGFVPAFGDSWDIIDGGTITGLFATENMPAAGLGQVYRVIYENDRVFVVLTCDADLTGDNTLDFFDVSIFLNFFSSEDVRGDLNNDGAFNFFDISLFLQLFSGGC